ncbi:peptidylprolyl isomerase [Sphingobium sufflavum]|uniref:peptidylprolyl isomerase n=1 Tax=Sphingobium sufflavum TaxID=1129547 RepID=UPI001F377045|nr:peptidylprolyl isomerase [Sphingobium sufflavum]MCE7795196.1 peptidylprolyl isomerase [Sphingobium sufflavum]
MKRMLPLAALAVSLIPALVAPLSAPLFAQAPEQAPEQAPTPSPPAPIPPVSPPGAPGPAKPSPKTLPVAIVTSAGTITIALEVERAPLTSANFLRYLDQKRLDGTSFYRAFTYPTDPGTGLIQGGTRNDPKRILKPVPHEPTSKTGLTHDDGALSMARGAPGSADGDFFIILGRMEGLDANPAAGGDNQGYAVFGHVVEGMDVVRAIAGAAKNPHLGVGVMKGQMLASPVKILGTRRIAPAK